MHSMCGNGTSKGKHHLHAVLWLSIKEAVMHPAATARQAGDFLALLHI